MVTRQAQFEESRSIFRDIDLSAYEEVRRDIQVLLYILWERRVTFLLVFLPIITLATLWVVLSPDRYDAKVVTVPVNEARLGNMGGLLGNFGGLAGLAGNFGWNRSSGLKSEALATLTSVDLLTEFVVENDLLPALFRAKYDWEKKTWKSDDPEKIPTVEQAIRRLQRRIVRVNDDPLTGVVTVRVRHANRMAVANWANDLVARTNARVRERAIQEASATIAYLEDQVNETSLVGIRQSIYQGLREQIGKITAAKVRDQYALRVIDPAVVPDPDFPSAPNRFLMAFVGFFAAFTLATGAALARGFLAKPVKKSGNAEESQA